MIPFSPPRIDQKTIDSVSETLNSGWITTGPKTKEFERRLTEYVGCKKTVALNSATMALEIMLRWYGVKEGDEVIVPAYTYCATANVVVHCGATVVFVDVGRDFNIDVDEIVKHITEKTKAIIPVDIGGMPVDYDEIMALVQRDDIKARFRPQTKEQELLGRIMVLADSAHSIGAKYKGKYTGATADAAAFSFHAVKNLTTAEGGAIALNFPGQIDNEALYNWLCVYTLHGQSKDALAKSKVGGWRYDVVNAGFKCNMMDIQAAIGLVELDRYEPETLPRRKAIFDSYTRAFEKEEWADVPVYETGTKQSSYHVYMLRVKPADEAMRDKIIEEISKKEVSVNVHFQPVPNFSFYKQLGYNTLDYPTAFHNYEQEISLPVYYDLTGEQVQTVVSTVKDAVRRVVNQ